MILRTQHTLARMGYDPGRLDGIFGGRTRSAIREAEKAAGLRQSGQPSGVLLADLDRRLARVIQGIEWLRLDDMHEIAPRFPSPHLPLLQAALIEIAATPLRKAHFIAQIAHESAGFATLVEYASGEAYEGRKDLGNTQPGDGVRYKGRGVIQLTGRSNYRQLGEYLGLGLEAQPDLAALPWVAYQVAAHYWLDRNINGDADRDDLEAVTRKINGGTNGLKSRATLLAKAKRAFFLDMT